MGYERLLTDFGHPMQGSLLNMSIVLPPKERVDLNEAKYKRVNFSKLQRDLFEMHQRTMATMCGPDWKFGLLCNVNK